MMVFDKSTRQAVVLVIKPNREDGSVHANLILAICEDVEVRVDSYMAASGTGTHTFKENVEFRSLESDYHYAYEGEVDDLSVAEGIVELPLFILF